MKVRILIRKYKQKHFMKNNKQDTVLNLIGSEQSNCSVTFPQKCRNRAFISKCFKEGVYKSVFKFFFLNIFLPVILIIIEFLNLKFSNLKTNLKLCIITPFQNYCQQQIYNQNVVLMCHVVINVKNWRLRDAVLPPHSTLRFSSGPPFLDPSRIGPIV